MCVGWAGGDCWATTRWSPCWTALDQVERELITGAFAFLPDDEDIHTAVERRVTEIAGDVGAKLHTGRSRNDQIATDLRLYAKRELRQVASEIIALQEVLVTRAKEAGDAYLPGYTHLQRAQPVLLAHHLLAHGWALSRDVDRLLATVDRLDVSPLGAGALAGSSLALDPDGVAEDLGFRARFENSLDAVSDRDFVAEALFDLALLGVHLSRIGEELVVWSTEEFGFAVLDDSFATGSSMLPQKKNPDVAELARGKAGRLIGNLTGLLGTLKGLPLSYNRDLQEDKEPLFDSVAQIASGSGRPDRPDGHGQLRDRPDAGGSRRLGGGRGGPGRVAGAAGHALPPGPRGSGRTGPRFDRAPCPPGRTGRGPSGARGRRRVPAPPGRRRHPADHSRQRRPAGRQDPAGAVRPPARVGPEPHPPRQLNRGRRRGDRVSDPAGGRLVR